MRRVLFGVFMLMALAAVGSGGEADRDKAPMTVATVAVADFQNRHPLLEQDWIGSAVADLISSALASAARDVGSGVSVLDRSAISALDREVRLAGEAGQARGAVATHVIGGNFTVTDGIVQFEVALAATGQSPLWSQRLSGPTETLAALARQVAAGAMASLGARAGSTPGTGKSGSRDLPLAALVTFQRGREAARRGDHVWAIADLLRACKIAPQYGEAWLLLGMSFESLGRPAAALAAWEQAALADPDDPGMPVALFRLARAREQQPAQARRLYQRLIDEYPFSPAPEELSAAKRTSGQAMTLAELAAQRLSRLVDQQPATALPLTATSAPVAGPATQSSSVSAGASLVAARLNQLQLFTEARGKGKPSGDWMEERQLRHALFAAAGGWPEGYPTLRLADAQPVVVEMIYRGVALAPPPGQVIERLTVASVPRPGQHLRAYSFILNSESPREPNSGGDRLVDSREGQPVTVTLGPWHAGGFFAQGAVWRADRSRPPTNEPEADLSLTAVLRPARPGTLWITTQPPGALISIGGVPRGVSPCRIIDLKPGQVTLTADSLVAKAQDGSHLPVQNYLHFSGTSVVSIAAEGETRVDWTLSHVPDRPASDWSALRLAMAAPLGAGVPGVTREFYHERHAVWPSLVSHPRLGLIAAWTHDRDLLFITSRDARTWSRSAPVPVNTADEEVLVGIDGSPQGQLMLVFRREKELLATTTDDLVTWSPAVRIAELSEAGNSEYVRSAVSGPVWAADGRWLVTYRAGYQQNCTRSVDGRTWDSGPTPIQSPKEWHADQTGRLWRFADGSPALCFLARGTRSQGRKASILRYALDSARQWVLRDQSPEFDCDRLWSWSRGLGIQASGDQEIDVIDPSGSGIRWNTGNNVVQPLVGPRVHSSEAIMAQGPAGPILMVQWAGSWWVAERGAAEPSPALPQVAYERPQSVPTDLPIAVAQQQPEAPQGAVVTTPMPRQDAASVVTAVMSANDEQDREPSAIDVAKTRKTRQIQALLGGLLLIGFALLVWWSMRRPGG